MLLKDQQIKLIDAYSTSMWVSNSSASHVAEVVRLSGARAADDGIHIDLFIPQRYAQALLNNTKHSSKISFLVASTSTFESYQIKGVFVDYRTCTAAEMELQKAYMEGFGQRLVEIGLKNGGSFASYYQEPSIAVRMQGQEIYEQTPKAGTGSKIS